jgi:hypothetical protein
MLMLNCFGSAVTVLLCVHRHSLCTPNPCELCNYCDKRFSFDSAQCDIILNRVEVFHADSIILIESIRFDCKVQKKSVFKNL